MKKKVLSLVLATLLIAAMAIPVSAASRIDYNIPYGNCEFNTYSYCYPNRYSCLAEYNSSTDSETNYRFQVRTLAIFTAEVNGEVAEFVQSSNSHMLASINRTYNDNVISKIIPAFYVNSVLVYEYDLNAA